LLEPLSPQAQAVIAKNMESLRISGEKHKK
jgi:hypothetical protein